MSTYTPPDPKWVNTFHRAESLAHRAAVAEAERDELRATLDRVRALRDEWADRDDSYPLFRALGVALAHHATP